MSAQSVLSLSNDRRVSVALGRLEAMREEFGSHAAAEMFVGSPTRSSG